MKKLSKKEKKQRKEKILFNPIPSYKKGCQSIKPRKYQNGGLLDMNSAPVPQGNMMYASEQGGLPPQPFMGVGMGGFGGGIPKFRAEDGMRIPQYYTGVQNVAVPTAGSNTDVISGAAGGTAMGANIGSNFGPQGAAIGGGIGLVAGTLKGFRDKKTKDMRWGDAQNTNAGIKQFGSFDRNNMKFQTVAKKGMRIPKYNMGTPNLGTPQFDISGQAGTDMVSQDSGMQGMQGAQAFAGALPQIGQQFGADEEAGAYLNLASSLGSAFMPRAKNGMQIPVNQPIKLMEGAELSNAMLIEAEKDEVLAYRDDTGKLVPYNSEAARVENMEEVEPGVYKAKKGIKSFLTGDMWKKSKLRRRKHSEQNVDGTTGEYLIGKEGLVIVPGKSAEDFMNGDDAAREAIWSNLSKEGTQKAKKGARIPKYQTGVPGLSTEDYVAQYGEYPGLEGMGYGDLLANPSIAETKMNYSIQQPATGERKDWFNKQNPNLEYADYANYARNVIGRNPGIGKQNTEANFGKNFDAAYSDRLQPKTNADPAPNFIPATQRTANSITSKAVKKGVDPGLVDGSWDAGDAYPSDNTVDLTTNVESQPDLTQSPRAIDPINKTIGDKDYTDNKNMYGGDLPDTAEPFTEFNIRGRNAYAQPGVKNYRGYQAMQTLPGLYNLGMGMFGGTDTLDLGRYRPDEMKYTDLSERDRKANLESRAVGRSNVSRGFTSRGQGQGALAMNEQRYLDQLGKINQGEARRYDNIGLQNVGIRNNAQMYNLRAQDRETMYGKQAEGMKQRFLAKGIDQTGKFGAVSRREGFARDRDALADYRQQQGLQIAAYKYGLTPEEVGSIFGNEPVTRSKLKRAEHQGLITKGGSSGGGSNNTSLNAPKKSFKDNYGISRTRNAVNTVKSDFNSVFNNQYKADHGESRFGNMQRGAREGVKSGYESSIDLLGNAYDYGKDAFSDTYDNVENKVQNISRKHRYRNPNAEARYEERQDKRRARADRESDKEYKRLTGQDYNN